MKRRTLAGKRALITGASSGIGRELALQLARRGVSLVLNARREARLRELQVGIDTRAQGAGKSTHERKSRSVRTCAVVGDVSLSATRSTALNTAQEQFGGLDFLINNAGISAHGRFQGASPERLRQIMEVNFFAAAELIRHALPLLRNGSEPLVVNIGSILGRRGVPYNSEYCASKFALIGFSEAIRAELARDHIDVLVVNPGTTDTEFFEHLIEETERPAWRKSKGVSPCTVARATIRAIERRKSEIVVGSRARWLLRLNRLAPRLVDRFLHRYV